MRLDRTASLLVFHPLARLRQAGGTPRTSILMYHSISNDPEAERRPYWQITTTPAQFRRQMSCLREVGCDVISLRDALETRATATARMRPRVVITFDDGYLDFMTDAFPVLDEFGFPATVFLPSAFIGDRPREFKGRRCLTWDQVRELQGRGVTFGSHTVSHPQLHDVDDEQLKHELLASKDEIEQRTGVGVNSFCYPYAFPEHDRAFCRRLREVLRLCGYAVGVSTIIGTLRATDDALWLPRLPVNERDDDRLLRAKIEGGYDWIHALQYLSKVVRNRRQ
jgi:peptidoglycan/xylan/chitin deacetylase (PgdA/CDA1 family)